MYSEVSICNMAFALLGEDSIRSFDDSNRRARLSQRLYEATRDYLLFRFDWPFARAYKYLKEVDTSDLDVPEGQHVFQLPSDCLVPRDIHPRGSKEPWEVYGNLLYTPLATVGLYYTRKETNTNLFSTTFANLLATALAVRLAPPLAQDDALTGQLYKQYQYELREVMESDANIGNTYRSYDEDPDNDSFVDPDMGYNLNV